jgi:DNA-binding transcriptional LysR family regulator
MDANKLRSFIKVAEYLNFTKAAEQLYIGQPALSRQIADLEKELGGVKLFFRSNRSVRLSPAGKVLLKESLDLISRIDTVIEKVKRANCGINGTLLVNESLLGKDFLPLIVKRFRDQYPAIDVQIVNNFPHPMSEALLREEADICFMPSFEAEKHHFLNHQKFYNDTLCMVLNRDHPLAGKANLTLADLAAESFIIFSRKDFPNAYDHIFKCCMNAGFVPNVISTPSNLEAILFQVESGMGVSLLLRNLAYSINNRLKYVLIGDNSEDDQIDIVWNPESSNPAVPLFIEMIQQSM